MPGGVSRVAACVSFDSLVVFSAGVVVVVVVVCSAPSSLPFSLGVEGTVVVDTVVSAVALPATVLVGVEEGVSGAVVVCEVSAAVPGCPEQPAKTSSSATIRAAIDRFIHYPLNPGGI